MGATINIKGNTVIITLDGKDKQSIIQRAADQYGRTMAEHEVLNQCYTIAGLAKRLNVSHTAADKLVNNGRIRFTVIG